MNWLESGGIMSAIGEFLAEDIGRGDITTHATVARDIRAQRTIVRNEQDPMTLRPMSGAGRHP